ncbi:unnamed protein product [Mytilus coruscus]|uniref:Kielin/chordin-like protein n=1 Tax=Mytilus coruscus TaxID=42192 RepID=A0A6J8DZN9_MYTCO|nr:unnamed protein product [Mytilus coruscus]
MCSRCKYKVHARFKNAIGHKIKDIKELGNQEEVDTFNFNEIICLQHSDQVGCVYCKTCKKVICVKCVSKVHNGHTYIGEEELDIKKKKINDDHKRAEGNIKFMAKILNKIEEIQEQEDAKFKKNKQDILIRREALKSEVDRYADILVKDLEQKWKSNSLVIETERCKMNKALEKLLISCNSAKIMTTSRDFKEFFYNFDQLAVSLAERNPPGRLDCHLGVLRFPKPEEFELLGRFIPAGQFKVTSFGSINCWFLEIHHNLLSKIECKVSKMFTTDLRNVHCMARCADGTLWIYDSISEKIQYINYEKNNIKVMLELQITVHGMLVMSACNNLLMSVASETRLQIINSTTGQITDSNYHVEPYACLSVPNCVHLTNNDTVTVGVGELKNKVEPAVIVMGHGGRRLAKYEQSWYNKPLFTRPKRITTTKNGNICVLDCPDADHKRVVVFGKKGEYKQIYTGCQYEGRNYRHGDTISADKCSRCICREGEVDCQRPQCSPPRCRNPVQQQGDCCPTCTECQYGGQTYQNLQRFTPSERPCLSCQCNKGEVVCEDKKLTCPPSSCSHPDTSPGQCCPSCRGCFFMRRKFRNNQKFVPPGGDACKICLCRDGTVDCKDMGCPPLNCINPVKPPGHCCGTCPMACTVLGKTYNEGQMFDDPKDKCSVCMCTNGEVRCQMRSCPQVTCSHPAQRPGECCPSCFMCRYNGQNILNGQKYIDPRQPCVECSCSYGIVTCKDNIGECPPISCPYPETEPGSCCPVCKPKDCVINGVVFKEGLTFTNPDDRCQDCQCDRGQPRCRTRSCPEVRCRYPSFTADRCCQECVDCSFNGILYKNGISFDHPTERCQTCQCSNGEVQCRRKECPSVSCQYPVMAGCCPVCAGCQYQNKRYEDGQRFISTEDSCLQCTCNSGNIVKRRKPCPSVTCQHPVQGTCCQECNNCLYENRVYRNRQRFPDPSSQCNMCECRDGTVSCTPRDCPLISCSNPASGTCCPECANCQYNGELVRNGANVQSTDDPCKQCYCRNGNIECRSQTCVQTNCQYPVMRGCCQECSDCMYQGKEQRNGDLFPDPTENCNECLCRDGNVNCRRKSCPPVQCNSPVAGDCCPTCGDCYHKNVLYSDGAQFSDLSDPCMKCSCNNGNVRCARKECNGRKCTHPVQGRCCPQCGGDCLFDGKRYDDGVTFKNRCEECTCTKGSVTCIPTRCLPVTCRHPVSDECCQVCTDCLYDRKRYRNTDRFQDPDDACQECYCQDGTVRCVKKQCPAVTCSDPVQGQCCPECTDCTYDGQFVRHGNTIADSKNPCSTCTCQNGNVRCSRITCRETCDHPANTTDCCPVCRDCFYEGKVQRNGVTFKSDVDPCRSCSCQNGNIVCETVICPVPKCDNPVTNRGECCPVCTVCQFHGGTFGDGQTFSNPRDKCQTCTCRAGRVRCDAVSCDIHCTHPRQGDCCPVCDDCMYEGRLIGNGDQYKPDPCSTCSCQSGNVGCLTQTCPRLTCPRTEKLPGQCCDVCLGCRYNGIYHSDGDAWTIDNNPCKTCACRGGIVTCMEMHCFSTCDNPITVPGQCCPVCPTCRHRDRIYSDGDMFSPSGDPCDLCECKVSTQRDRVYNDGDMFCPSGDPCDLCECKIEYTMRQSLQ